MRGVQLQQTAALLVCVTRGVKGVGDGRKRRLRVCNEAVLMGVGHSGTRLPRWDGCRVRSKAGLLLMWQW